MEFNPEMENLIILEVKREEGSHFKGKFNYKKYLCNLLKNVSKFSGCETGEGNCNHDDECRQPGRRCGDSSVNVPDLPADTRVCEELPKCDITQWNDGKYILHG